MIVYFDGYASEQRDFALRVNRLVEEMMDKEGSKELQLRDLEKEAKERVREIEFFVGKLMRDVRGGVFWRKGVGKEGWVVAYLRGGEWICFAFQSTVLGKMAEFMKETQGKDIPNLMKLQILGREFELRAREKDLFIEKLKGNMSY
ncbi:hypothetical protein Tco_1103070 [Tanacetum coccineum]